MNGMKKANKEVVLNLINNLDKFNEFVTAELEKMVRSAEQLQTSWNDPQYFTFNDAVQELNSSLLKDLDVLNDAVIELKKKVTMYD